MTTWYAQNSNVDIDSVNQWNDAPDGSGNWLTWANLDPADVLVANGKTSITINIDVTCATITSEANGGSAGGSFLVSASGRTIFANLQVGSGTLITISVPVAGETNIVGNVNASTTAGSSFCLSVTGTGAVSIVGNVVGGTQTFAQGISVGANAPISVTGNITGGSAGVNTFAIRGTASHTAGIVVTGNVVGGSSGSGYAVWNFSFVTMTVYGDVIANTASAGALTTLTLIGDLIASATQPAFVALQNLYLSGRLVCAANGRHPIASSCLVLVDTSIEQSHSYRSNNSGVAGDVRVFWTGGTNLGQPVESDVRLGTTFGASDEYTGSLRVPAAQFVSQGVLVDNTVGTLTGSLDAAELRAALGMATPNLDTQLTVIAENSVEAAVNSAIAAGHTID